MDPVSIIIEFEIATMLLAGVGAFATWIHNKHANRAHEQRETQHRELLQLHERRRRDRLAARKAVPIEITVSDAPAKSE